MPSAFTSAAESKKGEQNQPESRGGDSVFSVLSVFSVFSEDFLRSQATYVWFLASAMVRCLERDLPELLTFFQFPRRLWRQLRTTNRIERYFVELRRGTRPMVCFVNENSVDRIIYAIFNRYNPQWKNRTLRVFTQAA